MNLLEYMQPHLGSIEAWSSDILIYLFCYPPNESRLRAVAAFLYGNDVPLTIATEFHCCNAASSSFDLETLDNYYSYYQEHMYKHHMGKYYNMALRKYM